MAIIEEPLVEGVYQSLLNYLEISTKRDPLAPNAGKFMKDDFFAVFQVYPEEKGIVWARISSNTDGLGLRVVPLRVNNHPKAILVRKFANDANNASDLVKAINANTDALLLNAAMLRKIAEK